MGVDICLFDSRVGRFELSSEEKSKNNQKSTCLLMKLKPLKSATSTIGMAKANLTCIHFLFKVKGNIAELFLDIPDNFPLSSGGERVASLSQDLHQVVSEVTASQVQPEDGMGKSITFIDGDGVGDT